MVGVDQTPAPAGPQMGVPAEFVRYIVFHEMLHTVVPTDVHKGRRRDHPPAFNALERQFPEIDRLHTLARELLDVLV